MGLGIDLHGIAGVDARIGQMDDRLVQANKHLGTLIRRATRVTVPIVGSIVGDQAGTVATMLPGPEGGVEWHVRRISFAPQLTASVAAQGTLIVGRGTGLALKSQGSGDVVGIGGGNQSFQFIEITRTTTVPNALLFSNTQCVIRYPMNLIVVWVSGGGQLVIDGDAEEIPVGRLALAEA